MQRLNVWIPCFDDLDQLKGAIESTEPFADRLQVHVIDGRYATFEGENDLTPGAKAACRRHDHVEYLHPPGLPVGDPEAKPHLRSPQHEQATWVNYEVLPQDEWALEMDTDERLERLPTGALDDLDPRRKYTPTVLTPDDEQLTPAIRLYQPRYWTFWIDDVMLWREYYPRSTPLPELFEAHVQTAHRNIGYAGEVGGITIRNNGEERPSEYQERRADQLETMGVPWAGRAVRDGEYPSLVDDLTEYATEDELQS